MIIKILTDALLALASELEVLQVKNQELSNKVNRQQAIVAELEGKVQGWTARNSFIQSIELFSNIPDAKETLHFYNSQDGFFGGRVLGESSDNIKLQTFWIDDNPPSSWITAWIRDEQLPEGMKHVALPSYLQKTIRLYTKENL